MKKRTPEWQAIALELSPNMKHALVASTVVACAAAVRLTPSASDGFVLHLFNNNTGAVCLDGTPAGYYERPGLVDSWMIELEGGGWCVNEADCLSRSKTDSECEPREAEAVLRNVAILARCQSGRLCRGRRRGARAWTAAQTGCSAATAASRRFATGPQFT